MAGVTGVTRTSGARSPENGDKYLANDGQGDVDSLPIARLHFAAKKYKLCYFIISGFILRLS